MRFDRSAIAMESVRIPPRVAHRRLPLPPGQCHLACRPRDPRRHERGQVRSRDRRLTICPAPLLTWALVRSVGNWITRRRGALVAVADRFFPSSELCSVCGVVQEGLPLAIRTWTCPASQTMHGRDLKAAINLARYAVSSTASACAGEGSGSRHPAAVKPAPSKREVGTPTYGNPRNTSMTCIDEDMRRTCRRETRSGRPPAVRCLRSVRASASVP